MTGLVIVVGVAEGVPPGGARRRGLPRLGVHAMLEPGLDRGLERHLHLVTGRGKLDTVRLLRDLQGAGPKFIGTPVHENVPAGGTLHVNLGVAYLPPATLAGTITVTGASSNDPIKDVTVVVCPSSVAYGGGAAPERLSLRVLQGVTEGKCIRLVLGDEPVPRELDRLPRLLRMLGLCHAHRRQPDDDPQGGGGRRR